MDNSTIDSTYVDWYLETLEDLLLLNKRIRDGRIILSEENKKAIQNSIKELCTALGENFELMRCRRF